jgi:rsbT antagonist protein RsbS
MTRTVILGMGDNLVVPIQVELHDRAAQELQENILRQIERTGASGLVVDVSALSIVDSFLGRLLGETSKMARLMGAESVLVGLRKEVVITLTQLGFIARDLNVALNVEEGIRLLSQLKTARKRGRGLA